jgi:hypothetical protein
MNVDELIEAWDRGETITTLTMGGLGPGYEQAIQIAAVEFARATEGLDGTPNSEEASQAFRARCDLALKNHDEKLGGITGAMFEAASWLAWQWRFGTGGPEGLIERAKERGEEHRIIFASRTFP